MLSVHAKLMSWVKSFNCLKISWLDLYKICKIIWTVYFMPSIEVNHMHKLIINEKLERRLEKSNFFEMKLFF